MIEPVRSNPMSQIASLTRRTERAAERAAERVGTESAAPSGEPVAGAAVGSAAQAGGTTAIAGISTQLNTNRLAMLATLRMAMRSNEAVASALASYGRDG